jgi:uncharacterized OB-fold protein
MPAPVEPPSGELPTRAPGIVPETQEFWDATAQGRLLMKRCDDCGVVIWYPRDVCPDCHSRSTSWFEATGEGEIYSFTVTRRGQGRWRPAAPYVFAYVELDEGPRLMTNVVDCDPDTVHIGQRVSVVFHETGEGPALPRFRPS